MEQEIEIYDICGGYNPYSLEWGEEISFPSTRRLHEYGNRVYNRYPARSIFLVPRAILYQHKDRHLNILDPFMGSGTTAVETVISGNAAYGIEMNPFARLIAEVSCRPFEDANLIINEFQQIMTRWSEYPPVTKPCLSGIERWFKEGDLEALLKLRACIEDITSPITRSFFLVAFADCIKPVSLMERQSLKPYISKRFIKETKTAPDSFKYSFNTHYTAISELTELCTWGGIKWLGFDATEYEAPEESIDIAITSPPYINALDYTRCVKIEGALIGYIDNYVATYMRNIQVGHENRKNRPIADVVKSLFEPYYNQIASVDLGRAKTCLSYFNDIYLNLHLVLQSLRPGGEYHIIIGDNTIKKIEVPTHKIIADLAVNLGYEWFGYYKYQIKDHRTSIPRVAKHQKINYEYVLMLRKPK